MLPTLLLIMHEICSNSTIIIQLSEFYRKVQSHLHTREVYVVCHPFLLIAVNLFNFYSFFYPLEIVSRYRDPQTQVAEKYSYLFIVRSNICKY